MASYVYVYFSLAAAVLLGTGAFALVDKRATNAGIITADLYGKIQNILVNNTVPGYSVAIIRPQADVAIEFEAWGNRSEDGKPATSDVRTLMRVSLIFNAFMPTIHTDVD